MMVTADPSLLLAATDKVAAEEGDGRDKDPVGCVQGTLLPPSLAPKRTPGEVQERRAKSLSALWPSGVAPEASFLQIKMSIFS